MNGKGGKKRIQIVYICLWTNEKRRERKRSEEKENVRRSMDVTLTVAIVLYRIAAESESRTMKREQMHKTGVLSQRDYSFCLDVMLICKHKLLEDSHTSSNVNIAENYLYNDRSIEEINCYINQCTSTNTHICCYSLIE